MASLQLLQAFQRMEQSLCRVRNRTTLLRMANGQLTNHHGMAGRLLFHIRQVFFDAGIDGGPNNTQLAPQVGASNLNQVTALLNGAPGGNHNWLHRVRDYLPKFFDQLVAIHKGVDHAENVGAINEIRQRFQRFFFRMEPANGGMPPLPPFFAPERRYSSNPCSVNELCQEVDWFGRQPDVGYFAVRLTLVFGRMPFPPHDPRPQTPSRLLVSLAQAIQSGIRVRFLAPSLGSHIVQFLGQFQQQFPAAAGRENFTIVTRDAQELVPHPHYLFMESIRDGADPNDEHLERVVYGIRQSTLQHPLANHEPVAYSGTEAALAEFLEWHERPETWNLAAMNLTNVPGGS